MADAAEGIYGDEGSRIGRALDTMSRTLDEGDRQIADLEARLAATQTMSAASRVGHAGSGIVDRRPFTR